MHYLADKIEEVRKNIDDVITSKLLNFSSRICKSKKYNYQ